MPTNTLGKETDKLYKAIQKRKAVEAKIKALKAEEKLLEHEIFKLLNQQGLIRGTGMVANSAIKKMVVPTITNWKETLAYAMEKDNNDLLNQSLSSPAWRARYQTGVLVPGTEAFTRVSLSISKRKV